MSNIESKIEKARLLLDYHELRYSAALDLRDYKLAHEILAKRDEALEDLKYLLREQEDNQPDWGPY